MAYSKKALAKMLPTEREIAETIMALQRAEQKLKRIKPKVQAQEMLSKHALKRVPATTKEDWVADSALAKASKELNWDDPPQQKRRTK